MKMSFFAIALIGTACNRETTDLPSSFQSTDTPGLINECQAKDNEGRIIPFQIFDHYYNESPSTTLVFDKPLYGSDAKSFQVVYSRTFEDGAIRSIIVAKGLPIAQFPNALLEMDFKDELKGELRSGQQLQPGAFMGKYDSYEFSCGSWILGEK